MRRSNERSRTITKRAHKKMLTFAAGSSTALKLQKLESMCERLWLELVCLPLLKFVGWSVRVREETSRSLSRTSPSRYSGSTIIYGLCGRVVFLPICGPKMRSNCANMSPPKNKVVANSMAKILI